MAMGWGEIAPLYQRKEMDCWVETFPVTISEYNETKKIQDKVKAHPVYPVKLLYQCEVTYARKTERTIGGTAPGTAQK
jgi:hypothetical protein